MTVGLSPVPIAYDIREFGEIVMGVVILTVTLHIVISIVIDVNSKSKKTGRDERDIAIERRGAFWGYRILQIGVGVVVIGMLMNSAVDEGYYALITFSSPVQIIFGLIVTSYVADLVKHAVMIHGYGR